MGLFDTIKGLTKGRKKEIDQGIDKAASVVESKVPDQYDDKVGQAADAAKSAVDKLAD
ncbi:MAG: antitoxin [Ilumatobacteraceae bacterium]